MAKAIVTRRIEYIPANPNSKHRSIDINKIKSVDKCKDRTEYMDRTVIFLKGGGRRYSTESIFDISVAIEEAKNDQYKGDFTGEGSKAD